MTKIILMPHNLFDFSIKALLNLTRKMSSQKTFSLTYNRQSVFL